MIITANGIVRNHLILLSLLSGACVGQSAKDTGKADMQSPQFEVASIKRVQPGPSGPVGVTISPTGLVRASNITVNFLIAYAYNVSDYQVANSPEWAAVEKYEIQATVGTGAPTSDQVRIMFQQLLADRFNLSVRRSSRSMRVYALVAGKRGSRLSTSSPDEPSGVIFGPGIIEATAMSTTRLASILARQLATHVFDETGLSGQYNFKLESPDLGPGAVGGPKVEGVERGPSVFTALEEQLGLRLDSVSRPVDVILVEHIEHPTEN